MLFSYTVKLYLLLYIYKFNNLYIYIFSESPKNNYILGYNLLIWPKSLQLHSFSIMVILQYNSIENI